MAQTQYKLPILTVCMHIRFCINSSTIKNYIQQHALSLIAMTTEKRK